MKHFACGDVVSGCTAVFVGDSVEEILGLVAHHARQDHGLTDLPSELVASVRGAITTQAA
ncbi:DUF1059 domain-containing protein [Cryptosporangium sp. NPDC051539]|uniref:DUF1059 domain-containing protein n=1 Tax=Cryptosporangium sp. NPDC051539 TaxID=3363962 RepID=UPI0037B7F348